MFQVVLSDPPWDFEYWNAETTALRGAARAHYPVMSLEEICDLPIKEITAKNCVLFLWIPWAQLFWAQRVFDAWNFKYSSLGFIWVKSKRSGFGFHFGMGKVTRRNTEPCLLAIRGSMPAAVHHISELIYWPVMEHSRKPHDQYRKIEALYPDARKIELFARREQPGWTALGNEIDGKDIREALEELR